MEVARRYDAEVYVLSVAELPVPLQVTDQSRGLLSLVLLIAVIGIRWHSKDQSTEIAELP